MTLNNIGVLLSLLAMADFAVAVVKGNTPVHSLSAQELHEFTEHVRNHPELSAFAQGVKSQNRLPVKEDYNRLMKFIDRKEEDKKLQDAQREWEALHG